MAPLTALNFLGQLVYKSLQENVGKILTKINAVAVERPTALVDIAGHDSCPGCSLCQKTQSIVWSKDGKGECRKVEERMRMGPICRHPDLRRKPLRPFQYGFCKEYEPDMPLECPKSARGKCGQGCCVPQGIGDEKCQHLD